MDRDIWRLVMSNVKQACREVGDGGRRKPRYPNWLIVAMYLWGVWHDRCLSWACDRGHYGDLFRPRGALPSVSQFCRRVKADPFQEILRRVHERLRSCGVTSDLGYFDGRPLTVGPASKDPDAARGKVSGGYAKGYKLHAYVNEHRRIGVWSTMGLNVAEQSVALVLVPHLPPPASPADAAVILADSNYDSAPLHKALAAADADAGTADGHRLVTPLKGQQRVGKEGHHPVTLRQMGPQRRELVALWAANPGLVRHQLRARNNVEGVFSVLTACGLGHLPSFVRRLGRVRRWCGAKIILYHARLLAQERAAAGAAA